MDAEDIVQEAFLSLDDVPPEKIRNVKAYLCKIVTNRSIDRLRSASKLREQYVGPWLPEPLVFETDEQDDPFQQYLRKESISTAYLLLLEQLTWTERVVFLLREVLHYDYEEIAEIVNKSSANCRKIFSRAKKSLGYEPDRSEFPDLKNHPLVERFNHALTTGNTTQLLEFLSADAVLFTDGGGKVKSALRPIFGADRITRFFTGIRPSAPADLSCQIRWVNGQPGIVARVGGQLQGVFSFDIVKGRIRSIYLVTNPDKLTCLS